MTPNMRPTAPQRKGDQPTARLFRWLNAIKADPRIPAAGFEVAFEIGQHFNSKYGGEAWPGYQTIADATGIAKATVIRMVRLLEATGYFKVEHGCAGRGQSNRYWMTVPKGSPVDLSGPRKKGPSRRRKGPPEDLNYLEPPRGTANAVPHRGRESRQTGFDFPTDDRAGADAPPIIEGKIIERPVVLLDLHRAWRDLRAIWNRGWAGDNAPRALAVARCAFEDACERAAPEVIVEAAKAWRAAADAPRYLPKLAEWLNADGWRTAPPPKRARSSRAAPRKRMSGGAMMWHAE